ncbi:adenylate/guanylate cyclase domain-containing protein [Nocardioides marmotae]|uniref:Adenylate/guanylate cyclase domain-containing protein n=1 Tax=Nocardioides marmotae TaxID=2663857 RepID=A0A6I3JDC5_9ACTN|nr:adenylate/guanylate cyclase domain-containing protein [Nocardioides marmotae]MCR6032515.1 adenylate/guanylate cyclase domain-containing protein [Gordonia jinghuaiqii]MTB96164.1 adenylate/guanylate cyclase domain-containing protein [Nocardioides marmotae]QKD99760.1 adenylate/guanylate cyclase domain-containing protein [Nocardioides marmotae]
MSTSTLLLVVAVVLEAVGLAVLLGLWLGSRRRVRFLRAKVAALRGERRPPRRLVPRPDEVVKAVWETAALVREKGFGGALRSSVEELAGWAQVERPDLVRMAGADGTVAILFSDIEGSTALNDQLGDKAFVRLLARHDQLVRDRVARHGGHVVKTQGDGFMVAFPTAEAAVRCAASIQRALDRGRLRGRTPVAVRIGVHQGDVVHRDNDIFGRNVAHAARVAALAEGGEVLVSGPVADALADLDDVVLDQPRAVELKGLAGEHLVAAVDWSLA